MRRHETPVVVYATAGMRLLPLEASDAIWQGVRALLADPSQNPFYVDDVESDARTIPGQARRTMSVK